jgi:putative membrane protein
MTFSRLTPLAGLIALTLVAGCDRGNAPTAADSGPGYGGTTKAASAPSETSPASAGGTSTATEGASGAAGGMSSGAGVSSGSGTSGLGSATGNPDTGKGASTTGGMGTGTGSGGAGGNGMGTGGAGGSGTGAATPGTTPSTTSSPSGASDTPQSPGTGRGTGRSGDNKGAGLDNGGSGTTAAWDAGRVTALALTPTATTTAAGTATPGTTAATGSAAVPGAGTGTSAVLGAGPAASGSNVQSTGGVTSPHGGVAGARLPALTDRSFIANAAVGGMYEVAVGQVAAERASDAAVKSYAGMLVEQHTAANNELAQLATARGIALPAKLPAAKQSVIDRLAKAPAGSFDRQFVQQVGLKDHQTDIRLFEKAAKSGRDPEVKAWAAKTLPTLREHYAQAQQLQGAAGSGGKAAPGKQRAASASH